MALTEPQRYSDKKDHELTERVKQQIRDRIENGDGDVYRLAAEFHGAPIQVAGIKAAMHRVSDPPPKVIPPTVGIDDPIVVQKVLKQRLNSAKSHAGKKGMVFGSLRPNFWPSYTAVRMECVL